MPSPTMASASVTSMVALAGRKFLGYHDGGDDGHAGDAHDPEHDQHRHQPGARANAVEPEHQPRTCLLMALQAKVPLDGRKLVHACCEHDHASGDRPMGPVQRIHRDAYDRPDGDVRHREHRGGEQAPAGVGAPQQRRDRAGTSWPPSSRPTMR